MHFSDKKFEEAYMKIISEQTEEEPVQFSFVCKKCNTGFTDKDGVKVGDECPVAECDGKIEEFKLEDFSGDGFDIPTAYAAADKQDEDCNDCPDCDCQDEDECDLQDQDECDLQDEDEDECDLQDEDEDFQDFQDEDEDLQDDLQDEDADDKAAEADTADEQEAEATPETPVEPAQDEPADDLKDSKIVSFTVVDPAVVELLEKVQAGELKLVGVPMDFKFDEKDNNQNPDLTMEVLDNFDIEPVMGEDQGDEVPAADEAVTTDEPTEPVPEAEAEKTEEAPAEKVVKETKTVNCQEKIKINRPGKGMKYGPY